MKLFSPANCHARRRFLPPSWVMIGVLLVGIGTGEPPQSPLVFGQIPAVVPAAAAPSQVIWVPIPLPITGSVDTNVMQLIDRALSRVTAGGERPLLVLEFRPPAPSSRGPDVAAEAGGETARPTGQGSQFERSLALARYLTGERMRHVRTVAFVPKTVTGHAILPVLACEDLIVAPDAELGDASAGEAFIDPTVRRGYEEIAERRRTIPVPVVLGMLDPSLAVYRVRTPEGARFVLGGQLAALQQETAVGEIETVKREGDRGRLTGRDLRLKYGFASHEATDRASLATALRIPPQSLEIDPSLQDGWRPLRIDLRGPLNANLLGWVRKSLETRLRAGDRNLVWLWIESPGGSLTDSLSFASFLAEIPDNVRTVAFVPAEARSDAALIALACDHLVVGERAILGGPGAETEDAAALDNIRGPLEQIAQRQDRPWSWSAALVDSRVELFAFTRQGTGEQRWLSDAELQALDDQENWQRGAALPVAAGITGRQALDCNFARFSATNFDELRQLYHFEGEVELIEANWAHRLIESLASPRIAGLLLFLAWFALMVEIMTPTLTGAGLVSFVCFLLYFWSQFLHGTADWLEILLFAAGVASVALEIFVLPGFGVFGIGGGLLIITSLVLASQTFVIPRNAYQLSQLPASLWTVVAAGAGVVAALAILRRFLPHTSFFRRIMLEPPVAEELAELQRRESLVDWSHLLGQQGVTTTLLVPSGKARFGEEIIDVVSDGDMIERGVAIEVLEVLGNHVVVRQRTQE